MGLERLSPAERERLRAWLLARLPETTPAPVAPRPPEAPAVPAVAPVAPVQASAPEPGAAPAPVAPVSDAPVTLSGTAAQQFGVEQTDTGPQEIRARIVGEFTGWDGKTRFVLDNGQVWRQSTPGVYRHKATDPEVTITRAAIGYKLRLVSTRRSVNVRRVK